MKYVKHFNQHSEDYLSYRSAYSNALFNLQSTWGDPIQKKTIHWLIHLLVGQVA